MKRSPSVRAYVVGLVVAVALPLLAFGAFLLIRSAHNEQQAIAAAAQDRAEGAAADVGRELRNLQDLISIVATSQYAMSRPNWSAPLRDGPVGLVVRDLSGQQLLNTCMPNGRTFPVNDALRNLADGKAIISDLMLEPLSGEPILTIDLPIWREDNSAYVLSICALPRILQVLTEQHLPSGWSAMVIDRQGRTIAHTTEAAGGNVADAGNDPGALAAAIEFSTVNPWSNIGSAYRAFSPVDLAGWIVAISVPADIFFGPVRRSLLVLFSTGSGTVALVLVLAVNIGRRIARPIANLTGVAAALGSGGQIAPPITGIDETDMVAHTLRSTSQNLSRRTEELTQTIRALRRSENRLRKMSDDLRQALDQRTELLSRIVSTQESERQRIARELHDHLGQYFAALSLGLTAAEKSSKRNGGVDRTIADLKAITSVASREVHQLSWELRPASLDDLGLEAAIANYVDKWSERFNLKVDFVSNLEGRRLHAPIEITLYRVLQEAMTNVVKHADAARVSVALKANADEVHLIVEDDGMGFVQDGSCVSGKQAGGFGLIGMRERLAMVGGSLNVKTAPNRGTALFYRIPAAWSARN